MIAISRPTSIWAIVPAKRLEGAKGRLNPMLSEGERTELSRAMLRDVVAAARSTEGLAGVAVITADPDAAAIARQEGAAHIRDISSSLNEALAQAARTVKTYGADGMMIIHGDLPLADPLELDEVVDAARLPGAVLVPARADGGTNVMLVAPTDGLGFRYGADSFAKHRDAALQAGIPITTLELPGLSLDIDRPEDLRAFAAREPRGHTAEYLLASGLARQLQQKPEVKAPEAKTEDAS